MGEYNFWDDRTYENNDDYYCPIINSYCLSQNCSECDDNKEFCKYYNTERLTNCE